MTRPLSRRETWYQPETVDATAIGDPEPQRLRTGEWTGFLLTAADLLELEPRPLFSERRAMERMGQARLALHLLLRPAIYSRVTPSWLTRAYLRWSRR